MNSWQQYIHDCDSVPFTEVDGGDVIYMECVNRVFSNNNETFFDQPKYRPILIINGTDLKEHNELTSQLDEDPIDKRAYYCIPLTGTHHEHDPKHQFDVQLEPEQLHYPRNNKTPYARPSNIFKFTAEDMNEIYAKQDDPELQSSIYNRKIGYMKPQDIDRLLNELAENTERQNNVIRERGHSKGHIYLTPLAPNPTKLSYELHPTIGVDPFEKPAVNDPDIPIWPS